MISTPILLLKSKVDMFNHRGALANLTAAINDANSSIPEHEYREKDSPRLLRLYPPDRKDRIQLANIMRKIRIMPDVPARQP